MAFSANEVAILITAKDQASRALEDIGKKAGGLGNALKSIAPIALGAGAAIGGVAYVAVDFVKAAAEEEAGMKKLQQAIADTTALHGDMAAAQELMRTKAEPLVAAMTDLAYSDDDTRAALSLLMAQTGDVDDAMRRLRVAADLARGGNIDLTTASKLLGKMTDENANTLKRMGVVLGDNATVTEALAAVQAKFGGQAAVYAKTAEGSWARFGLQMQEVKETIGAALLPAVTKVGTALADFVSTHQADIQRMVERIAALVGEGFERLSQWFRRHGPEIKEGLASFAQFIRNVEEAWKDIQPIVETIFRIWENEIATKLKAIKDICDFFMAVFSGDWGKAWESIKQLVLDLFEGLKRDFELRLQLLGQLFGGFVQGVVDAITGLPGTMAGLVGQWFEAARGLGDAMWRGLMEGLKQAPGMVGAFLTGIWDAIKGLINQAIDAVNNAIPNSISKFGIGIDLPDNPIPRLAAGLRNFQGGLALVGERGPELVALPRGSDVYSAQESRRMAGNVYNYNYNVSPAVQFTGPITIRQQADLDQLVDRVNRSFYESVKELERAKGL